MAACAGSWPLAAPAHGFGQRFDLPLPLWLWLTGAGATIVVTFALVAVFVREERPWARDRRLDLLRFRAVRWIANGATASALRVAAAFLFVLTVLAGLFGNPDPYSNLITTMVWVAWWVGVAFFCALVGDIWSVINPWSTLFAWCERAFAAVTHGGRLARDVRYPAGLGAWPAVLAFLGFAWAELIWPGKNVPERLGMMLLGYSVYTWAGMLAYGREAWLRNAEAFTLAFGVLGRFAPIEIVRASPAGDPRGLSLRPFGAGLRTQRPVSWSFMVFVILMLATVTYDGFQETPLMQRIETAAQASHTVASILFDLSDMGLEESIAIRSLTLVAFVVAFVAIFWSVSWIALRRHRGRHGSATKLSASTVACSFVLTLVPIAVAYHLSHYFSLLLTAGQFIIPLASDPFGWGWNLFGTAGYKVNLAIVSPYVFWYSAVAIIVVGHVVAVFLAHDVAVRLFGREALAREVPMVLLMVAYTCLSLWILAQPIVG
jgi:hypothetical protein